MSPSHHSYSDKVEYDTVEISVGGMTCSMCSDAVTKALQTVEGVHSIHVSLATNLARIEYDRQYITSSQLKDEIEDIGYDVMDVMELPSTTSATAGTGSLTVVELSVGGMTCSMCTSAVHAALVALPDVHSCHVSLSTNTARVEILSSTNAEVLKETIEDIGYDVHDVTVINNDVEETQQRPEDDRLGRLFTTQEAHLKARKRAFVWSFVGAFPILTITMVLPRLLDPDCDLMTYLHSVHTFLGRDMVTEALWLWALTTPVQFLCGYSFYKTSYYGILRGVLGMDVLVALGTTASYVYAMMATLSGDPKGYRFFETSAVLICFVLLGKWMNAMAVCRTSEALTQLMKLQARTALKVTFDNPQLERDDWNPLHHPYSEHTVPIQDIHSGDMVKVLKGASVPADGILRHGEMSVDESMITGESIPVLKTPGSLVLGGTICVETGSGKLEAKVAAGAFCEVTGVGSQTALAQIVQLMQEAQSRQVPIQNLADSISAIFVPSVVAISVLTFLIWYVCCKGGIVPAAWYEGESPATFSLLFGIACLVISCPCALGLATPTAVMVGTGVGARHGVLMKGGETLEVASQIDSVIFDKTGTLTRGRPVVTDFIKTLADDSFLKERMNGSGNATGPKKDVDAFLVWLLGSLERNSEHPLATAIVSYAESKIGSYDLAVHPFAQPSNFVALTGRGAAGTIHGSISVAIGNRAFCERQKIEIGPEIEIELERIETEGKTAILACVDLEVAAVLGVADELKEEALPSIEYLQEIGLDVWMVTGDSKRTADAIAKKLNLPVERVISEALPSTKVEQVRHLQENGYKVAMVGDGVNDSPALAESDCGMSMGTGAEIATEASDMVLVSGKVSDVCTALHLSRVIFRRIQLNLLFSMVYNLLGIPLAAGVLFPILHTRVPPTVAAMAMALSSFSVVFSSLALRLYQPPDLSRTTPGGRRQRRLPQTLTLNHRNTTTQQYHDVNADIEDEGLLSNLEMV